MARLKNLYFYKALGYKFIDEISLENVSFFKDLDSMSLALKSCELCHLSKTRANVMLPIAKEAKVMVVYESPNEAQNASGKTLECKKALNFRELLEENLGITSGDISENFLLKCYGTCDNIALNMCSGYLFEEIDKISPKIILAMGELVSNILLGKGLSLNTARGSLFRYKKSLVMPLFSLDFIYKNPSKKDLFLQDIKRVKEFI